MSGTGRQGIFGSSGTGGGRSGLTPELGLTSPYAALPAPSWKGRALGALFFLGALVCVCFSVYNGAHAAGMAGRQGTITVEACRVEQGSRNSSDTTVCSGTFRPEDGSRAVPGAEVTRELRQGEKIEVQQSGNGFVPVGFREIWRWNALFFFAWIVAALGVPFAATGIFPGRQQAFAVGQRVRGTRAAVVMKYLYIGGGGGIAVCLYMIWVL
ncbi:hypothetical protein DB35_18980 [Streptomyces abyssalis]|uniref:Uncharacterized protein n=1 Tax=Streptomyces abyssalis TaxID=933944 RepID=A0A1E7JL77_9ACTN|nr:hypothetical protein [Streptomyces abyssalis]OEU88396.1 hypothetical protein AN215_20125 [Streptomyces abyssalis]OEU89133.1 hypothetical protein DB35_18980 [Streptomyces abyssalis]OEV06873.1 hypothetical protein AN219_33200 [Streptomyces nanshensis]